MSRKSPIFPMPQSHHFSDYGFDPQIDYFQVLEEAKKHRKENPSIDTFQFKIQKPISKDDLIRATLHNNKKKKRWFFWKKAFVFFKSRKWPISAGDGDMAELDDRDVHMARARNFRAAGAGSVSGPVYVTESWSGSSTPYRTTTVRASSGLIVGTLSPAIPYLSLRELNMERQQRISTSGPVYLVT